jgi:oligosaccharide repeat unit polymerase
MYVFLLGATGGVIVLAVSLSYLRTRDSFHPLVFIGPMFLALYVLLPSKLLYEGDLANYLNEDQLIFIQKVTLCGVFSFCLGCMVASWKKPESTEAIQLSPRLRERMFIGAVILGTLGVLGYVIGIANVGGFWQAYGQAYGGGVSDSGYIRELWSVCIPAIVLILIGGTGQKLSPVKWITILVFALPFVLQGSLGARRGPTFLIVISIGVGWYMMRNRRPAILTVLTVGIGVGLLLLLLATNRSSMFLGSDWNLETSPLEYTKAGTGNEYIYGAGTIIHFSTTGEFYWGRRYLVILFVRPIPKQLWPHKYSDVRIPQIEENLGSGVEELSDTLGWVGALGAAGGLVSDMWIEFWWLSMAVLFLIGWCYGYCWRLSCIKGRFAAVIYVLMTSLTVFLVTQTLEAMLVRFLFMIVPAWLIWQWVKAAPRRGRVPGYYLIARERLPLAEPGAVSAGGLYLAPQVNSFHNSTE